MKRILAILLRFVALLVIYMLVGGIFGMYRNFNFWQMLIMGSVVCGIMIAISELLYRKK